MSDHVLVTFGFGPIAAGLFTNEAFQSGNFHRLVVAEIDSELVAAVKENNGTYNLNIACSDRIETAKVTGVELLDPNNDTDRQTLCRALAEATEIATCLPSVDFYDCGTATNVAALIAEGLANSKANATIVYTAENNNRAAEILQELVKSKAGDLDPTKSQFLNTVIAKMSQTVTDPGEIKKRELTPIAPTVSRAFLVEQFNKILVTRATLPGFRPGIEVFIEKDDLLPFEEVKFYGHNAVHTLIGCLGTLTGCEKMSQLRDNRQIMKVAEDVLLKETGPALQEKYAHLADPLFTEEGFKAFVDDLLERTTNPYLGDSTARAARDITRKLRAGDRIFGTMTLALEHGIEPTNMAVGAMAALAVLLRRQASCGEQADTYNLPAELRCDNWRNLKTAGIEKILNWLWVGRKSESAARLITLTAEAKTRLAELLDS